MLSANDMSGVAPAGQHPPGRDTKAKTDRLSVVILTGALGSGKTTLLGELLLRPEFSSAALLINEWGDVGIDHELVRGVVENIVLLESGCICCTIQGDLRSGLLDLAAQRASGLIDFTGPVVIETTGLASPMPLMQLFNSDIGIRHHFRLDAIVTVVDAVRFAEQSRQLPDLIDQVCAADALYLAKTDLASAADQRRLSAMLHDLNGSARQIEAGDGTVASLATWLAEAPGERRKPSIGLPTRVPARHLGDISSFVINCSSPVSKRAFMSWIQLLLQSHGNCLLRLKGPVLFEDGTQLVQSAGPLFHPLAAWDGADPRTRLVCIVRGLDARAIRASFDAVAARRHAWRAAPPAPEPEDVRTLSSQLSGRVVAGLETLMADDLPPAMLWNLHNPWSVAGQHVDAWPFLDLCEDPEVLAIARQRIGPDIALIETEVISAPQAGSDGDARHLRVDARPMPITPLAGVELRLRLPRSLSGVEAGLCQVWAAPLGEAWTFDPDRDRAVLVIRYMPTTSQFVRENDFPANLERQRRLPLANIAAAPIWLVSGRDHAGNNYARGFDQIRAEWLNA